MSIICFMFYVNYIIIKQTKKPIQFRVWGTCPSLGGHVVLLSPFFFTLLNGLQNILMLIMIKIWFSNQILKFVVWSTYKIMMQSIITLCFYSIWKVVIVFCHFSYYSKACKFETTPSFERFPVPQDKMKAILLRLK